MLLLQAYTILFSIALAWLNKIPCEKMINYGASLNEEKNFHRANGLVKVLYCAICAINVQQLVALPLLLLIMWVVFDGALGFFLHDDVTYIGETAKTDKLLKKVLGEYAGLVKILVASSVILVINFFL